MGIIFLHLKQKLAIVIIRQFFYLNFKIIPVFLWNGPYILFYHILFMSHSIIKVFAKHQFGHAFVYNTIDF